MDVPNGTGKGKGKGKGKARQDGEEPVARPGEVTPKRSPRPSPSGSGSPASTPSKAAAFCKGVTGPVKLPHPKQVAILAACVSALAACRSLFIPVRMDNSKLKHQICKSQQRCRARSIPHGYV